MLSIYDMHNLCLLSLFIEFQSINQSINQSNHQSINQSMKFLKCQNHLKKHQLSHIVYIVYAFKNTKDEKKYLENPASNKLCTVSLLSDFIIHSDSSLLLL